MTKILPKTNLQDHAIRNTLNRGGGKTDNKFWTYFSPNAKTNGWSKKKPTKYRNLIFAKGNENPAQWQADNGLCGFKEESIIFGSKAELIAAFNNNETYVYEPPTGGTEYPFRSGDYRGYNPDALPPVWSFDRTGQIYANQTSSEVTFTLLGRSNVDTETELTLQDILFDAASSLADCSFCVIVAEKSGTIRLTKTGSTLGNGTYFSKSVTVTRSELQTTGSYIAYPAFVDPYGSKFIAAPIGYIEFQVLASPDAEKLGWVDGTGKWIMKDGENFMCQGQLAYTSSWEGQQVFIELQINGVNSGRGSTVTLVKDSQSSDGKTFYMTYTRSMKLDILGGEIFRLRVGYGSNWANNDYLRLDYVPEEDIEP